MTKAPLALGALLLGGGVSLSSAYMLGAFDGLDYELPYQWDGKTGFKQQALEEGCVKNLFGRIPENNSASTTIENNDVAAWSGTATGCLVVNWDKWKGTVSGSETRGQGTFRFLWAMKSEKKGFIVFGSGDTTTSSQMTFKAATYFLNSSPFGTITKKKEAVGGDKKVDSSKFLQNEEKLEGIEDSHKTFGGFTDTGSWSKLETLTLSDDAKNMKNRDAYFRGYWTGNTETGNDSKPASGGSSKWSDWWGVVFSDMSACKIADAVANIKGTWKKAFIGSKINIQTNNAPR